MRQFGIFGKYWEPGKAKTRLAATIGPERAAALARSMLAATLERFRAAGDVRTLYGSPALRAVELAALAGQAYAYHDQGEGDLGARMARYFSTSLARGAEQVVLIGSDSPTLPIAHVDEAFRRLESHDVVLGPSEDGGYYLIAARHAVPPIFEEMPWSESALWRATLDRLEQSRISYAVLPPWYDIDDFADLARLARELGEVANAGPALAELQRLIGESIAARAD